MTRYTLLFFDEGAARASIEMDEWRRLAQAHADYRDRLSAAGVVVVDHQVLEPDVRTRTAELKEGTLTGLSDGPLESGRWVLGGFYVVDVPATVAVSDLVAAAPLPRGTGHIEVRPVV
jgi:hypothetical protein